ncbi:MAG: amidohydrolase family protein [Pseudomonadota bacterium]|nr:amidohydrolase family protein [Pseudomonadota bacterium]
MTTAGPARALHNQPPDPNPRTPRHPVPPGAWDCHIHLFGPAAQFPFESHSPYTSDDALPEDYLRMQEQLHMAYAVIVSAGGYGRNTRHLEQVLARFPGRFRGIILPPVDFSPERIAPLHALGVRGIRMFGGPAGHEWSHLPGIEPHLAEMVHEAGWHVQYQSLVHGHLLQVADHLLAMPTPIVLDHFGAFDASLGLRQPAFITVLELLETGRVWVKLSAPMRSTREEFPYAAMRPFAEALVRHAPERLLWGSDWPHVQLNDRLMPNDGDLLDLFADWVPDERTRQRILSENPRELYA